MAYTMEDFKKDYVKENLGVLSPDDRLKGLSLEEIQQYLKNKQGRQDS